MTERKPRRDRGDGSIRNRGTDRNPRWFAYYWVAIEPEPMLNSDGSPSLDGQGRPKMRTRRQVSEGPFKLKGDAQAWLKAELRSKDEGRARVPTSKTVGQGLTEWLEVRRHNLSPNTYAEYERMIRLRIRPHLGAVRFKDLGPVHIAKMLTALRQPGANRRGVGGDKRLSETSLQHTLTLLHTCCEWAIRQRWIGFNPCVDVERPKREENEMLVWTGAELSTFLAKVADDRLFPLWRLAATTGARRSELLGLLWPDLDLDAGTMFVHRRRIKVEAGMVEVEGTKTRSGKRYVDLDPQTVKVLKRWRRTQKAERMAWGPAWGGGDRPGERGHVFSAADGQPLHGDHVQGRFDRLVDETAGVPRIRFHDLRHTHATLLLRPKPQGAGRPLHEVAKRLGHSPAVCLTIYAHVVEGQGAEGAAAVADLVDGVR